ncbi:MAG: hypothetical protein WBV60_19255, partial [Terriglobales bacterium]
MDTLVPTAQVYNVIGKESDTRQDRPVVDFESALKGHGFSRAVSVTFSLRLYRVLKNSILFPLLGGAAVYRCDKRP